MIAVKAPSKKQAAKAARRHFGLPKELNEVVAEKYEGKGRFVLELRNGEKFRYIKAFGEPQIFDEGGAVIPTTHEEIISQEPGELHMDRPRENEGRAPDADVDERPVLDDNWFKGATVMDGDRVISEGMSDLAIAIGEHAFTAGWDACLSWLEGAGYNITANDDPEKQKAWSAYDPPEDLKGR